MVELCRDQFPAAMQLAHQHVGRHFDVVVVGGRRRIADCLDQSVRKAGRIGVDNQQRDALVARQIRAGAGCQPDIVGRLGARSP